MEVCLMVEGQEDVTWEQWLALAETCERAGLAGLFRSDHYVSVQGKQERGSLDAWATLAALAARTSRIRLGTLVSPVTFRHPSLLAKTVVTVDHISGGRVELGMGAGWHVAEHLAYGFPFPETGTRMELLAEQVEIVVRQWQEDTLDFHGRHYQLEGLHARPRPVQQPHPPLILGGMAGPRSAALAARWADEYNTAFASPEACRERRARLDAACKRAGRDPASLRFSLMTGCVVGRDRAEVLERAARVQARGNGGGEPAEQWVERLAPEWLIGTVDEVVERLRAYEAAGVQRVMLQHQAHDDLEMVRLLGEEVAPAVAS